MTTAALIGLAAFGIVLLLILVVVVRLHAFIALLITSLVVGVVGGIPLSEIADEIQQGMGSTLGYIAIVIGLGAMFGEVLQRSGGATVIARHLLETLGEERAPWALGLTGLIVSVPVFFDVALILFIPLIYSLGRRTGRSLLYYGIPLMAGMAVAHAFIPPTPGPVAVAGLLGADLGWVILFGVAAGIPATAVGGIWWGRRISARLHVDIPDYMDVPEDSQSPAHALPEFGVAAGLIILPLVLIFLGTASKLLFEAGSFASELLSFVGHPFTALIVVTLVSFYALGTRLGFSPGEVRQIATKSLEPIGLIILVTGAGGVFGKVLIATGVGDAVATVVAASSLPIVLLAFLLATVVRVAQGSATVSMVTAAGLMAPVVEASGLSAPMVGAVTIAIAAGATVLSHVNDSGFWLVSRYLGMSEQETLRSWTVMETIVGLTGLAAILIVSMFF